MGLLIDIISIAVLVFLICKGWKNGFIKSVIGLISIVLSLVFAINLFHIPSAYIKDNVIKPYFADETSKTFSALMNGGTEVIPIEKIFDDKPQALSDTAEKFGIDVSLIEEYYETAVKNIVGSFDVKGVADKLSDFVVDSVADTVSNVLGFVAVFLISLLILTLLMHIINLIFKLPALNFANKLTGSMFGAIKAFMLVVVITNIVLSLASVSGNNSENITGLEKFWSKEAVVSSYSYSVVDTMGLIF